MSTKMDSRKDGNSSNQYNPERISRWRKHAERHAREVESMPIYNSARLIADEEGKPLSELIVDILCRERLQGKVVKRLHKETDGMAAIRLYNAHMDTFVESHESPARRDNYERKIVKRAFDFVVENTEHILHRLNMRERSALLRRYYVKGDLTAHKAVMRAIHFAVGGAE